MRSDCSGPWVLSRKQVRRMIRWEAVLIAGSAACSVWSWVWCSAQPWCSPLAKDSEPDSSFRPVGHLFAVAAIGGVIAAIVPRPPLCQTRHPRSNQRTSSR